MGTVDIEFGYLSNSATVLRSWQIAEFSTRLLTRKCIAKPRDGVTVGVDPPLERKLGETTCHFCGGLSILPAETLTTTDLLEQALAQASKLSPQEQGILAGWLLKKLEAEDRWGKTFAASQDTLSKLGAEAVVEHRQGKTRERLIPADDTITSQNLFVAERFLTRRGRESFSDNERWNMES